MNSKFALLAAAVLTVAALPGCGEKEKPEMPENTISYENRDGKDLVPVTETEIAGEEIPYDLDEDALPSEEELGEYQEIFMEGDIIDDETRAGWVIRVSLKDITVNTYNELTTYVYEGDAYDTAVHLEPGDAVVLTWRKDEDGTDYVSNIGRVRVEDAPLTREEVMEQYGAAQETEAPDGE